MTAACYTGLSSVSKSSHQLPWFLRLVSTWSQKHPFYPFFLTSSLACSYLNIWKLHVFQPILVQRVHMYLCCWGKALICWPRCDGFSVLFQAWGKEPKVWAWAQSQEDLSCGAKHHRRASTPTRGSFWSLQDTEFRSIRYLQLLIIQQGQNSWRGLCMHI